MYQTAVLVLTQVLHLSAHINHGGVEVDLVKSLDLMSKNLFHAKSDDFRCKSTFVQANKPKVLSVEKSKDIVLPLRVRLSPNLMNEPHAFLKFQIGDTFPR